jgi:hypothetical protein
LDRLAHARVLLDEEDVVAARREEASRLASYGPAADDERVVDARGV